MRDNFLLHLSISAYEFPYLIIQGFRLASWLFDEILLYDSKSGAGGSIIFLQSWRGGLLAHPVTMFLANFYLIKFAEI